jgi:hypothetical protein
MAAKNRLPKRFEPFLQQATTEAELRYGGQEATFATVLGQLARDRDRRLDAQATAQSALLGSLKGADANVDRYYKESGLDPSVLSTLAQDSTGKRLAGEMAGYRSQNQQGLLGSLAGDQYQRSRINEDYTDRSGTVFDQAAAEQKERGTFVQSLLGQLIQGDRSARSAANAQAREQSHDDLQAELDRAASQGNALIGQGLTTDTEGNLLPLPGGKADPSAPGNKPKRTTGPGTANKDAQLTAGKEFSRALGLAGGMAKGKPVTPENRRRIANNLATGRGASGGETIYDEVPVLDARGVPKKDEDGKPITKQVPRVDPKTGTRETTPTRPAVSAVDGTIAAAATEQAMFGYVTTATVRELQKLGYSVNQIPGLKTENQAKATRPQHKPKQRSRPKTTGSIRDIYG